MVKVALASNSKGLTKIKLFSQGAEACQNLRYKSLIIVDPEYVEISDLDVLITK